MTDGVILEYGYFVSKAYLKSEYKEDYKPDLRLRWRFTWTKQNFETLSSRICLLNKQKVVQFVRKSILPDLLFAA